MQKQNDALCVVYARAEKCLSDFWHQTTFGWREVLAAEPDRSIFLQSMSVCQEEEIFTAPLLHFCVLMWNVNVRVFFFLFPARSYKAEKQMLAFCLTLPKPLWEVCGCVCVCVLIFFLHQSSSITLSELGSGEGMLSVIDLWPVECSVSQIATYWFAVRYLFKETRRSSWQISEHLAGPSLSICGHPVDVAIAQNSYHRD